MNTLQFLKAKKANRQTASQGQVPGRPAWLIQETAADGSYRWYVRLPFSDHVIGESSFYGPFCHEATARTFETRAYNALFDAIQEVRNMANELHEGEIRQADGEPAWMGDLRTLRPVR